MQADCLVNKDMPIYLSSYPIALTHTHTHSLLHSPNLCFFCVYVSQSLSVISLYDLSAFLSLECKLVCSPFHLSGGIDYMLLVMIKLGWITKMQEKEYNYYIQLWLRAPGTIYICISLYSERVTEIETEKKREIKAIEERREGKREEV